MHTAPPPAVDPIEATVARILASAALVEGRSAPADVEAVAARILASDRVSADAGEVEALAVQIVSSVALACVATDSADADEVVARRIIEA